jgi:hypothetical protein
LEGDIQTEITRIGKSTTYCKTSFLYSFPFFRKGSRVQFIYLHDLDPVCVALPYGVDEKAAQAGIAAWLKYREAQKK